jgi:hypothetical protein
MPALADRLTVRPNDTEGRRLAESGVEPRPPVDAIDGLAGLAPPPAPVAPQRGASLLRRVLQDREALVREVVEGVPHDLSAVALSAVALTGLGGLALGAFNGALQAGAAAVKVPLVTLGALAVCFPAFFIFGVLQGSKVTVAQALRLFAVGLGLRGAIVAALAPLLLFFASVGSPYGFVLLLAGAVFGAADLCFLRTVERGVETLRRVRKDDFGLGLVRGWALAYLVVATQLTWTLRPIIGEPGQGFELFGGPGGNMLAYFASHVLRMFS